MLSLTQNLSLRARLLGAFGIVAVLLTAVGALGFLGASAQGRSATNRTQLDSVVREVDLIRFYDADVSGWQVAYALDAYTSPKPITAKDANRVAELVDKASLAKLLPAFPVRYLTPAERPTFAAIQRGWAAFWRLDNEIFGLYERGGAANLAKASALANGPSTNVFYALSTATLALSGSVQQRSAALAAHAKHIGSVVRILILVGTAIALLAALSAALLVTRSVVRPARQLAERLQSLDANDLDVMQAGLQALAAGDLTHAVSASTEAIPNPSNDEIGAASRSANGLITKVGSALNDYNRARLSLSAMISQLATTAGGLVHTSESLAASSHETERAHEEITRAMEEVAEGATRQATEMARTRRAAEDVAAGVTQSSQDASDLARLATETRKVAEQGVGAAHEANRSIIAVRDSAQAVTNGIHHLADQSQRIGAITETIQGLAEQTNMLALNAAIEAARAGEQGRGFAIVAEEVRKLADGARAAASEIGELITAIQAETVDVTQLVEQAAGRAHGGVDVVDQAKAAFVDIDRAVEAIAARIRDVAVTADAAAAESVAMQSSIDVAASLAESSSAATQQVSASTQQTVASSQQIAASAQELALTANELNQMASRFSPVSA